jgi:hypothetical protein
VPPVRVDEIVAALSRSLGEVRARDAVVSAANERGLSGPSMSRDEALALLETMTETAGAVGLCARFTRSYLMLQWARGTVARGG